MSDPFPYKVEYDFASHAGSAKGEKKGFKTEADRAKWIRANKKNIKNVKKNNV